MLVLGLDVCVPNRVVQRLEGNGVGCVCANHGEMDRHWFQRTLAAKADCIVSTDSDLEILCYDHNVPFVKWQPDLDVGELLLKVTEALAKE